VHLGERECSIQRRHQKIIEESPSCILDNKLRAEMGEAAVKAAAACGYRNAGTIEFMLDQSGKFYFLEMNTRLQVEHPVTEMVTGLDLVKEQIRIAAGEPLGYSQGDVEFRGHAIECRVYAEDPENNFMPSIGAIDFLAPPSGPGVRDDSGYCSGSEVSIYYDPLLSKLITWGRDRTEAIARMKRALAEYHVHGVQTSIPFCQLVMNHPKFVAGDFDTHFIENELLTGDGAIDLNGGAADHAELEAVALAAAIFHRGKQKSPALDFSANHRPAASAWKLAGRHRR